MKKILSTVAMAIVAFTAVVSMSSCSNDDASSMNAAPQVQVTAQPRTHAYEYKAQVTNDALKYFDIVITRIDGTTSQELAFTEPTTLDGADAMQLKDGYISENVNVKYNIKVTPKSNWKELLEATGSDKMHVAVAMSYRANGGSSSQSDYPYVGEYTMDTDSDVQELAGIIAQSLTNEYMNH